MENNTITPEEIITSKKMKMIYSILPEQYTNSMTQGELNKLLKTPLVKLEKKLDDMQLNIFVKMLSGKIQTEPIKK